MFEHLDDPQPPRSGTQEQISAARRGGHLLIRRHRRSQLAVGSVALATTAGVSTVAAVGLPGGAGGASTSGATGTAAPASVAATTAAVPTPAVATVITVTSAPAPSAAPAPTSSAVATSAVVPSSAPAPTSAVPSTTPAPTAACLQETARLRQSVEPAGYVRTDAGDAAIAWNNPAGPLTHVVVGVRCAPFSASDVPAGQGPVKLVTVLDAHHWVIGTASSGHLQEVWNADNGTAVTIDATVVPSTAEITAENLLSTFGNYLID